MSLDLDDVGRYLPKSGAPKPSAPPVPRRSAARPRVDDNVPRRIAAGVAFIGSFATTYLFVAAIGGNGWIGLAIAAAAEFVLQMCKTSSNGGLRWGGHGIDAVLNGGGVYLFVQALPATTVWQMVVAGLGLGDGMSATAALVLALAIGAVLSVAPQALWKG